MKDQKNEPMPETDEGPEEHSPEMYFGEPEEINSPDQIITNQQT